MPRIKNVQLLAKRAILALGLSLAGALLPANEAKANPFAYVHYNGYLDCSGLYYGEPDGLAAAHLLVEPARFGGSILQVRARFQFFDQYDQISANVAEVSQVSPIPRNEMLLIQEAPSNLNTPTHASLYSAFVTGFSTIQPPPAVVPVPVIIKDGPLLAADRGFIPTPVGPVGTQCFYSNIIPEE